MIILKSNCENFIFFLLKIVIRCFVEKCENLKCFEFILNDLKCKSKSIFISSNSFDYFICLY